jgi:type IV secretory pathway VirJ component
MTLLFVLLAAISTDCDPARALEYPAAKPSDRFAVFMTGDGGWRPVDEKITKTLNANGVSVVGVSTPDYYSKRRTPEESACALADLIRRYQQAWKTQKVIVIGFSRGADVVPFMINRLPDDIRSSLQLVALLGPEPTINFEYHPFWSIYRYIHHPPLFPVRPEIESMKGLNVLCVYGEQEGDSLCPMLDATQFKIVREPGGHHYGGRYDEVAKAILDAAR